MEIFAQTRPRIKGFSSGIQRKQRSDPLHVPPWGRSGWRLCLWVESSGSARVCKRFCSIWHSVSVRTYRKMHIWFWVCKNALTAAFLFKAISMIPLLHHFTWPVWCSGHFTCKHKDTQNLVFVKHWCLLSSSPPIFCRAFAMYVYKNMLKVACMERGVCVSGGFGSLVGVEGVWVQFNCEQGPLYRYSCIYTCHIDGISKKNSIKGKI